MRTYRVMATVADTRCCPEFVRALREEGMDSVRINSAHVSVDTLRRMVDTIRSVDPQIGILMDTKGPELRTTTLPQSFTVTAGDEIELREGPEDSTSDVIRVNVGGLLDCLSAGGEVLLDDGALRFVIEEVDSRRARLRVIDGGEVGSRKTIAFPRAERLPKLPAVSERDRTMIAAAVDCGIDMIAHSFVRSAADVEAVGRLIMGSGIELYAKIECQQALDNLELIADTADGLLIARGDLGTQIPLPEIPAAQLRAAMAARRRGKPSILATQILQSMLTRPTPTRAEISDIALAVMEGIDCLLLTGETAQGEYPRECVAILNETINATSDLRCRISMTI